MRSPKEQTSQPHLDSSNEVLSCALRKESALSAVWVFDRKPISDNMYARRIYVPRIVFVPIPARPTSEFVKFHLSELSFRSRHS